MYWVFAHERIGNLDRLFLLSALVIRVHQVELDLPAEIGERIPCLDRLEDLDAPRIVAALDRRLGGLVGFLDVADFGLLLVVIGAAGHDGGGSDNYGETAHRAAETVV